MDKNSAIDYFACILIRIFSPIIRSLPLEAGLFLGRRIGELLYCFDLKHKAIVYSNLKTVFADKLSPSKINCLAKEFYRNFGQGLIEIFFIPLVDKEYIEKYISIEGLDNIREGFKRGKGVILLGVHEGSWELSGAISMNLGFPFNLFIREQSFPRLNRLLNLYRGHKGGKIIHRDNQIRQLIYVLENNEAMGMTMDQGGRNGILVKFFGRDASMAQGAIRLALKYDAAVIPCFYVRQRGPYIKVIIEPPFNITKTEDTNKDVRDNLQKIAQIFERYILRYPKEYLWSYKIWKYSKERRILILNDGKTGHLRQSQSIAAIAGNYFKNKGITANIETAEIKFKNKPLKSLLILNSCLMLGRRCQGCLWCLRAFLPHDSYKALAMSKPDIVISCGSSLAAANFIISKENTAKSIVVMRPSILSTDRFDLVVIPRHDRCRKKKNVAITEGALNLIDDNYINSQVSILKPQVEIDRNLVIGLLLGGGTKRFNLTSDLLASLVSGVKLFLEEYDGNILITTSRRTGPLLERMIKNEFNGYGRCKLLVIANEKNIPEAVGGIVGLSQIVIVSAESISMISEAAASGRYVVVFSSRVDRRHTRFLNYLDRGKYIYIAKPGEIYKILAGIYKDKPRINLLNDRFIVESALKKII